MDTQALDADRMIWTSTIFYFFYWASVGFREFIQIQLVFQAGMPECRNAGMCGRPLFNLNGLKMNGCSIILHATGGRGNVDKKLP